MDSGLRIFSLFTVLVLLISIAGCVGTSNDFFGTDDGGNADPTDSLGREEKYTTDTDTKDTQLQGTVPSVSEQYIYGEYSSIDFQNFTIHFKDSRKYISDSILYVISREQLISLDLGIEHKYTQDFFADNILLFMQIKGSSALEVVSIEGIIEADGLLHPILNINSPGLQPTDVIYTLVSVEIKKADIKYEFGELLFRNLWYYRYGADEFVDSGSFRGTIVPSKNITSEDTTGEHASLSYSNAVVRWAHKSTVFGGGVRIVTSWMDLRRFGLDTALQYDNAFFEDNALMLIEYESSSSVDVLGLAGIVDINDRLCPVLYTGSNEILNCDITYSLVTAEMRRADIEGLGEGESFTLHTTYNSGAEGYTGTFKGTIVK